MRLTPGTRVGPYEVVALLGAGGMAEVYRAKDTRLGRDVAIKVVSEALGADGAFLDRFEREAKLAGSLNHPNVVALHDVGLHDGKPYFVTELLQGETLRERLSKGSIPLATALEWAAQMAQGLAAAHERGIVHRDLKPENVFINRDGHVKLLDFGIAKLVEAAQGATPHGLMDATVSPSGGSTGTGMVLGTPGYMSPEQVRGDPVDARTDFFSLGAVLYEMLCGRRAFPAGPVVESGYAILHNEPEPLPAAVSPQVAQVVHRCLEKDPGRRFQSARDLAFNLALLRAPTGTGTPMPPGTPRKARARPRALGLGIVITMLGVVGLTYFVGSRTVAPASAIRIEPITFRLGLVSGSRFTPDSRVVFSAAWDGEPSEVFVRSPGAVEAQPLGLRDARLLSVSAKGDLAVLWHPLEEFGVLATVSGAGGTPRELAKDVASADWTPSGELAAVRQVGWKQQVEFPLGNPVFQTAGWLLSPRVSPLGDLLAVIHITMNAPDELLLVDRRGHVRTLKTFPMVQLTPEQKSPTSLAWLPTGSEVWFSTNNAIWAAPLSGTPRLVYQGTNDLLLEDIASTGTALVIASDVRKEIGFVGPGTQRERRLSIFGSGELAALSDDGRNILFNESLPEGTFTYIRATDGTPAAKLGPGTARTLSPDQKWALTTPDGDHRSVSVLPVGVGEASTLNVPGLYVWESRWLQDNRRMVFLGLAEDAKEMSLYVMPLAGGTPTRISPPIGRSYFDVSRDDRLVAIRGIDDIITLYPVEGGTPLPLPELGKDVFPAGWSKDGELWVRSSREMPNRLLRFDITRRKVVEERTVGPSDPTGIPWLDLVRITPDGRALVFNYQRWSGRVLLVDGLLPARR